MGNEQQPGGFAHEALFYRGAAEFEALALAFVEEGLRAGEAVMVMVAAAKLDVVRGALGADADRTELVDMETEGRNPARIIPRWAAFFGEHAATGRPARGLGEPIWPERSPAELLECQLHEALINLAFGTSRGRLVCPYDLDVLDQDVVGEARRSHPLLTDSAETHPSTACAATPWLDPRFQEPLPEPTGPVDALAFDDVNVPAVRTFVAQRGATFGMRPERAADVALAVHELAANSIRHGGGAGAVRLWFEHDALVCEVRDAGRITDPLAGRRVPRSDSDGGRGLWIANHLTDLSQVRTGPEGTVVRLRVGR